MSGRLITLKRIKGAGWIGEFGRTLYGTVTVAGTPDTPVQRLILVYVEERGRNGAIQPARMDIFARFWSGADGSWSLTGLDPARTFTVITYDQTGIYDPVIKGGLILT